MADHEEPFPGPGSDGAGRSAARRSRSARLVVAAVAVIATVTACESTRHSTNDRTPHAQQPKHGSSCGLRVAESAITRKDHYSAGARNQDGDQFLASAVIENPCRLAATNATFAVSPLDEQGHALVSAGRPVQAHFTIALIMPGGRAAGWTYFTRQDVPSGIASLKVQQAALFGPSCWIDSAASVYRTAARATNVTVGKRDTRRSLTNGDADISFTVTWRPEGSALGRRSASVIFRDSSGRLLDASGQSIGADAKPGQQKRFVSWVPSNADPARTEVILEPEPDAHGLPYSPSPSCLANP